METARATAAEATKADASDADRAHGEHVTTRTASPRPRVGLGSVDDAQRRRQPVSTAQAAADTAIGTAAASALAAHEADTTAVHGIADTSALVLTGDARLSDTRTPTDNTVTAAEIVAAPKPVRHRSGRDRGSPRRSARQPPLQRAGNDSRLSDYPHPDRAQDQSRDRRLGCPRCHRHWRHPQRRRGHPPLNLGDQDTRAVQVPRHRAVREGHRQGGRGHRRRAVQLDARRRRRLPAAPHRRPQHDRQRDHRHRRRLRRQGPAHQQQGHRDRVQPDPVLHHQQRQRVRPLRRPEQHPRPRRPLHQQVAGAASAAVDDRRRHRHRRAEARPVGHGRGVRRRTGATSTPSPASCSHPIDATTLKVGGTRSRSTSATPSPPHSWPARTSPSPPTTRATRSPSPRRVVAVRCHSAGRGRRARHRRAPR